MGSKIENNDLRLAEERKILLRKGVKLVTSQLDSIIANSEYVFVSFLSYNKSTQRFEPIDLINTNPLFDKSKEFQAQGEQSFYYAREAIRQNNYSANFLAQYEDNLWAAIGNELKVSTKLQKLGQKIQCLYLQ